MPQWCLNEVSLCVLNVVIEIQFESIVVYLFMLTSVRHLIGVNCRKLSHYFFSKTPVLTHFLKQIKLGLCRELFGS